MEFREIMLWTILYFVFGGILIPVINIGYKWYLVRIKNIRYEMDLETLIRKDDMSFIWIFIILYPIILIIGSIVLLNNYITDITDSYFKEKIDVNMKEHIISDYKRVIRQAVENGNTKKAERLSKELENYT